MATKPLICKADLANTLIQGGHFDRCTFVVTKDSSILNSFNLCDFSLDIDDFFSQSLTLNGGSAFLLDDAGLANSFGEIKFFMAKVEYSSSFTKDSDKYINLIYEGKTYPIGEINIWSGQPGDSAGMGIAVKPKETNSDPLYEQGGIVLHNPHAYQVTVKVVIASGGAYGSAGTGTSGTSGYSSTSGTSGTSGSTPLPADYFGTSGTLITIPT